MEPITAGLVAGGANLLGSGINAFTQGKMNASTQRWNERMFGKQVDQDWIKWQAQNEYNSPGAQMERLKKGGLNPNLVYGSGTNATSGPIGDSGVASWNPKAPEISLGNAANSGLAAYYDVQLKTAQVDNLKSQNTVLAQDAALKAATTGKTLSDTARSQFDLSQADRLKDISAQAAEANLHKTMTDTKFQLNEDERRTAQTSSGLREAAERILKSRSDRATSTVERQRIGEAIKNLSSNTELQNLDIQLRKQGIGPNDPVYLRMLGRAIDLGAGIKDFTNDIGNELKKFKFFNKR